MNMRPTLVAVLLVVSLMAGAAFAETKGRGPCASEVDKFCKDVERGQGRIRACLKQHEKDLSDSCKQQIAQAVKRAGPCSDDIQKLCSTVTPGQGAIRTCLKQHAAELSAGCKAQLESGGRPRGDKR